MKMMNLLTTALLITITTLTGCQTNEAEQPLPDRSRNLTEKQVNLPEFWTYEKEITHEGSRSEGLTGRLFYRYKEIPPVFKVIKIGEIVFEYVPMEHLWDDSGYIQKENSVPFPAVLCQQNISSRELKKGWYRIDDGKKTGTPGNWVRVETDLMNFYAAPDKLTDLAEAYK
jgi:hypothetical protein